MELQEALQEGAREVARAEVRVAEIQETTKVEIQVETFSQMLQRSRHMSLQLWVKR